jgi:hypothetical protein
MLIDSRNKDTRGRTIVPDKADLRRRSNPLNWTDVPTPEYSISGLGAYRHDKKGRVCATSTAVNYRDPADASDRAVKASSRSVPSVATSL